MYRVEGVESETECSHVVCLMSIDSTWCLIRSGEVRREYMSHDRRLFWAVYVEGTEERHSVFAERLD